jgi:Uma2 family endonuclease
MPTVIQTDPPLHEREPLPTMYDLPSEEIGESGMPDEFHFRQASLLWETFQPLSISPDHVFSAIDLYLYYDVNHTNWYKRPDWFGVIGVPRMYEGHDFRLSYVIWQERVAPLIVVELLAPESDEGELAQPMRVTDEPPTKWEVYERILRVPYYAIFGRQETDLRVFQLNDKSYEEVTGHNGRFWLAEAELGLGLWQGSHNRYERLWLRWYDSQGNWIPTAEERLICAQQERLRAEQEIMEMEAESKHREQLRQCIARMEELLRHLGQDPDQV